MKQHLPDGGAWLQSIAARAFAIGLAGISSAVVAGETVTYTYDALGRITGVAHSGSTNNGVGATYVYDLAGNRKQVVISGAQGGPIVADSSFEDPPLGTGFAYAPTPAGVTFSASAGIAANGSAWGFATAPNGSQVAFLQAAGGSQATIDQAVSGLVPGRSYRVAFSAAQRPGYPTNGVSVSVAGVTLFAATPASSSGFTRYTTSNFTAASNIASIHFATDVGQVDTAVGIDQVSVEDAAVALSTPNAGDGSFEDPNVGSAGFRYTPSAPGVTFSGGAGVAANGSAWGFPSAPGGSQVGFIQSAQSGTGVIDQTLSGLVPGRVYHLSFMAAQRPGYATSPIVVSVSGTTILLLTPGSAASYTSYATQSFAASSATMVVRWTSPPSATDAASAIDNITVVEE